MYYMLNDASLFFCHEPKGCVVSSHCRSIYARLILEPQIKCSAMHCLFLNRNYIRMFDRVVLATLSALKYIDA